MDKRSQPRYQIFVSSTFRDLIDERQSALKAILELQQFAAGMEIFPAANSTPWEIIEKMISDSDYYVLIIGGKYGSTENGISYTEKEYDYAFSNQKHILAFLHGDPNKIPVGKSELDEVAREKLESFRKKVSGRHHIKFWSSPEDLRSNLITALALAFANSPATGWVKASGQDNAELMSKMITLQEKYDSLRSEYEALKSKADEDLDLQKFANDEDELLISFEYHGNNVEEQSIATDWSTLFFGMADLLLSSQSTERMDLRYKFLVIKEFRKKDGYVAPNFPKVHGKLQKKEQAAELIPNIQSILNQFLLHRLIEPKHFDAIENGNTVFKTRWSLTPKGQQKYLRAVAFMKDSDQDEEDNVPKE